MPKYLTIFFFFFSLNCFSQKDVGKRLTDETYRHLEMNGNKTNFSYVYKNNSPYGKNASVKYDEFYKTYTINFTKENGITTGCAIKESAFIGQWEFKYNGAIYKLQK